MKASGKSLAKKLAVVVTLLFFALVGFFWLQYKKSNEITAEYRLILNKFSKKSELVVTGATVNTTTNKKFNSDMTKNWPKWTRTFSDLLVSRKVILKIPVKTDFKLQVGQLSQKDISIQNNVLMFKKPLIVNVDSQQDGQLEIKKSSSGIVDKVTDLFTANKKSMEFLEEKSQDAIYQTSEKVTNSQGRQEKVAKYAEESLEKLLNLNSKKKIDVKIKPSDLKFVNVDPKK
ncbi:hypothetical protein [Streptococcus caballi]|uniref:hypothetical protein n=1 Tax=Streptococcus caballi TaxID=439220 RepID=UPI0003776326|nr:hypothetical protein [Streptococcus caballi]